MFKNYTIVFSSNIMWKYFIHLQKLKKKSSEMYRFFFKTVMVIQILCIEET